jgi:thioester reductase-like protein
MTGAKLVLAQSERKSDPNYLISIINHHHITVTHFVPSVFAVFLNTSNVESCSSLRHVICSGEALPLHLKTLFYETFSQCRLHNLYGPTEASIDVSYYDCQHEFACQTVPIGKPIANTQLYILDQTNNPVPIGVPGELHIGGVGLARGYLNSPDLTAQKFINNPFGTQTKLYRTGDLARYLSDGNIEFLGRIDDQVKIRGLRIELGEIESVIRDHHGIQDVVVIAREDSGQEKRLAAYIIAQDELSIHDLKLQLAQQLPDYMIPQHFITLKQFPITPNGKLDRKALPVPNFIPRIDNPYVAPGNTIERQLAILWASLLKLPTDHISIHDNFFQLGGHSLSAVQLIAKIRDELSLNLPMQSIFQHPTIFQLADFILSWQEDTRAGQDNEVSRLDQDIFLEKDISVKHLFSLKEPINNLFFTGATGFLGAFLLKDILVNYKNAKVYCLVRESNLTQASKKIISNLKKYRVWHDDFVSRIIPVLGDLSQPLFGTSKNNFNFLAEQIDVIFHNGAMVNHVYSYQQHKNANVLGVHEILRLASQIKTKPVHYISTLGVYSSHETPNQPLREDDDIVFAPIEGYSQSKWVSEKIIRLARARGMPINIYRPGRMTGHSKTGIGNHDDAIARIIKGCIQLKMMPHTAMKIDFTPVDYVSNAIVTIAQQSAWLNRSFNIMNPDFISLDEIGHHIQSIGFPLQKVDYATWHRTLLEGLLKNRPNVLHAYLPVLNESTLNHHYLHNIKCDNTIQALGEHHSTAILATHQLLQAYFSYLIESNYLQQEQVERMS